MEFADIREVGITAPMAFLMGMHRKGNEDWRCDFIFRARISLPDGRIVEIDDVAHVRGKQRGRKPRRPVEPAPGSRGEAT